MMPRPTAMIVPIATHVPLTWARTPAFHNAMTAPSDEDEIADEKEVDEAHGGPPGDG